jgi:glycosyltransferase involved in cell wall biosynthesis
MPVYPGFRFSPLLLTRKRIRQVIQKTNPDIIHIQNHFMIGKIVLKIAQELGIPIIGTNHFMPENLIHYLHLPSFLEERLKRIGWQQFVRVYSQLSIVTAPTKTASELMHRHGLTREVIVLSCGIDLQRFNPNNNGTYLKERYNIPDRPIILYVGRLDKEKNIEVILRAMPLILEKTGAQLVLTGVGALRNHLENIVQELGLHKHVVFTGFVADEDLPNLYRLADIFVIAGIAELQSIVTMEAMASALPVVAVNAVALPELIHHGENGFLFSDGDSQAVAERVTHILTNERLKREMGQKSLSLIQAHDMNRVVRQFELLYRSATETYLHTSSKVLKEKCCTENRQ